MWPAGDPAYRVGFLALPSGPRVRVIERGSADAPSVLLLPGWGVCAYTFRGNMPGLAAAGYRAIAVDLKGHGRSDKPEGKGDYTLEAFVSHVQEIIGTLGLVRPAIVAQSMAGRIAVELALAAPETIRRVALISPVTLGRVRFIRLGRLSSKRVFDPLARAAGSRALVRLALEAAYGTLATVDSKDVDEYWAQSQFPGFIAATRRLLGHFTWDHAPDRVAAMRVPVTVFRGTRDRLVAANALGLAQAAELSLGTVAAGAGGADRKLLILDGAGHALNEEAPDLLAKALVEAVRVD